MKLSPLLLLPALVSGLVWVACDEPLSHIYTAEHYFANEDCLAPGHAIDVVAGPPNDAGFCDAICITDLDGNVYVSGECPPYPTAFDLNMDAKAVNPLCAKAFAASCRQCPIEPDAGVAIICEAGAPEDAGKVDAEDAKDAKKDAKAD